MNIDTFDQLALGEPLTKALNDVGYEKPSPIQAQTIPLLLSGTDVLGQAQTGTGKTAAFALPALAQIDLTNKAPQVLVLAPTRELAIQVAEAFKTYASHMKGFHVLPVYGGQDYRVQTRALDRGVHVIVGTPGRIMDHIRRGNIKLTQLKTFILDEADEMLRMGFIDDVEWVLDKLPEKRQMALFSATMPRQIARIAEKYLKDPEIVKIEIKTRTADTIRQRFWPVSGRNKLDALTRILEAEEIDAMLVFVRTKTSTVEISEKLEARGYACAPLNGDIQQKQRERTVEHLKQGKLDIIVATDVAARGLDVARVSHVLNYDIPSDTEAYIHRIGRTGRAGRSGEAILFVAPREKRMKQTIERATGKSIDQMEMPTTDEINKQRIGRFKLRINDTITNENLSFYETLVNDYTKEYPEQTPTQVAAALAHLLQGDVPFLQPVSSKRHDRGDRNDQGANRSANRSANKSERQPDRHRKGDRASGKSFKDKPERHNSHDHVDKRHKADQSSQDKAKHEKSKHERSHDKPKIPMEHFRIEVGQMHDVKASNIVGAIANEAGLESQFIGTVEIHDKYSTVQLPEGMPKAIFKDLKKVWVCGQKLQITKIKREREAFARSKDSDQHDSLPHKGKRHSPRHTDSSDGDQRRGSKDGRSSKSSPGRFTAKKRHAPNKAKGDKFGSDKPKRDDTRGENGRSEKSRSEKGRTEQNRSEADSRPAKTGNNKTRSDNTRSDKAGAGKPKSGKSAFAKKHNSKSDGKRKSKENGQKHQSNKSVKRKKESS